MAAVAASIFVHIQEQMKPGESLDRLISTAKGDVLLIFAYLAIIANCSATVTSFLLSDKLVEAPFYAAHKVDPDEHRGNLNKLFDMYMDWSLWAPFKYCCEAPIMTRRWRLTERAYATRDI